MPRRPLVRYSVAAHEPQLSRSARRAGGVYYTPPEIAQQLAELTLGPLLSPLSPGGRGAGGEGAAMREASAPLRILDPACGAGELLIAAHAVIRAREGFAASMHGIDIDESAAAQCRQRLGQAGADAIQIQPGDALAEEPPFPAGAFDVVLANPPYVSIRELARQRTPDEVVALRERFRTARGNFDLYVLFIERALQWLRPGGRCGLIVPNKWATLDYARPCRELLQEQATLEDVVDLSAHRVFRDASVYPHLLVFTLGVESQVATQPLGSLVRLACGTPGYAAARIASLLAEVDAAPSSALPFITSGNIDRYAIRTGNVRYQRRRWRDPRIAPDSSVLTRRQRQLFASPKLVIAGLTRRLEAAWDAQGLALGVQVFAATEFQADPFYLLALLNSKLLSYLFRTRFAAKRLGGGYVAVNKGQLARLPVVDCSRFNSDDQQRLVRLVVLAKGSSDRSLQLAAADAEIDRLVYKLYRLTAQQIGQVEAHFSELSAPRKAAA